MINVNDLKPRITFKVQDDIYVVLESQHSKQARGQASVKVKAKNLRTGSIITKTFNGGEKVQKAHISLKEMIFLYNDDHNVVLMDQKTFVQIEIPSHKLAWELKFLIEGEKVKARCYNDEILDIELPIKVNLKVIFAPETVKGNTQSNPQKKVKLETGFELEVPMFIKSNETIIVSTETGKYLGRSKQ